ncbi:MAG: hypothetical protein ACJ77K_06525 [Bacteroidia bacterium]
MKNPHIQKGITLQVVSPDKRTTPRKKAIFLIQVEPHEIYFAPDIRDYRGITLLLYCLYHHIEMIDCYVIIGEYQSFEKDVFPKISSSDLTKKANLILMHDSHELSRGVIIAANMISKLSRLGLEVRFIKDFAVSVGRY